MGGLLKCRCAGPGERVNRPGRRAHRRGRSIRRAGSVTVIRRPRHRGRDVRPRAAALGRRGRQRTAEGGRAADRSCSGKLLSRMTAPKAAPRAARHKRRYGAHEVLPGGVTLAAAAGDVIAVIGASSSGKSTLLRCINLARGNAPNAGRIVPLDGEETGARARSATGARRRATRGSCSGCGPGWRWCSSTSTGGRLRR